MERGKEEIFIHPDLQFHQYLHAPIWTGYIMNNMT